MTVVLSVESLQNITDLDVYKRSSAQKDQGLVNKPEHCQEIDAHTDMLPHFM